MCGGRCWLTRSGDTWKSGVPGEPGTLKVGSISGYDIRRYRDAGFNCGRNSAWVIKVGVARLVQAAWLFTWVGREVPGAETGCCATRWINLPLQSRFSRVRFLISNGIQFFLYHQTWYIDHGIEHVSLEVFGFVLILFSQHQVLQPLSRGINVS